MFAVVAFTKAKNGGNSNVHQKMNGLRKCGRHIQGEIYHSALKRQTILTSYNREGYKNCDKLSKPETKGQIRYDITYEAPTVIKYIRHRKWSVAFPGMDRRGHESCLMDRVLVLQDEKF
jgi:hypothetical protein